jgi:hypothetical protein
MAKILFRSKLILGCLLATLMHVTAQPGENNSKIALLVAVGDYPSETGWQKINSQNDVALIRNALLAQGFPDAGITVLTDHQATREGILTAIRQQLLDQERPGTAVYFHFSGHGQQVADDNGDELDGFDEAIVPVNSHMTYQPGMYEGQNLIRDDELGQLFNEIRAQAGPQGSLLAVLDACHSGTGTRGFGIARGTVTKMAPEGYTAANLSRGTDQTTLESVSAGDERRLAPMVAYFGAAQNQLNFETTDETGNNVGSLSYAFSKKFARASPRTTYRSLFEQIRLEMSAIAPRQQPQAEGSLDREILSGGIVGAPAYFQVSHWNDPVSVKVEAGWLHGVYEGTVIGLFPLGTVSISGKAPLAKGIVRNADATSCYLELESDLDQETAEEAWAFVLESSFGNLQLGVKLALPEGHPLTPLLERRLEKLPVRLQDNLPDLIVTEAVENARGTTVQLLTNNDAVLETFPDGLRPEVLAERIVRQMMAYGQARFLKNLELTSYELPLEFELVPIKYNRRNNSVEGEIPISDKLDYAGVVHFKDGDVVKIKVTNNGYRPAYFTLLDIQPDNKINVLIPAASETPAEFLVPPGKTIEVKRLFEFGPPAGTEVFKLIATDTPIDLRPIAASRGGGTKSNSTAFEQLFSQTFYNDEMQSRGGKTIAIGVTEVSVCSFSFIID